MACVSPRLQECSAVGLASLAPQRFYTEADAKKPLFALQHKVPKLPVPSLEDTLARYLRSVQPLATPDEFENTKVR